MKILRVISSMDPTAGGPCQGIRNSIPALTDLGVHNEVVCLDTPNAAYLGRDRFKIHAIGPAKGPWAHADTLIPWLKENAIDFDAVIVHGLWQFTSYAVYKALKTTKEKQIPYFVMPHGMLDPYFQKAPERRLKAIRNWVFWKLIEGKVVNNAKGVLFTCEEELLLARETFTPYKPNKELNVGYGIQTPPAFKPEMTEAFVKKCSNLNNKPFLLFLSRIHHKKGLDLLLDAYHNYVSQNGASFDLVIAGPGLESEFGKGLLEHVETHINIKPHVHFTGMLSGDAKWGAFYNSEAFILPSHQENFGIAIVEALACSKPVLISNKVNIWREIKGETAGLVENDDAKGTLNLLSNFGALKAEEKVEMQENALATFKTYYSINPAADRLNTTLQLAISS